MNASSKGEAFVCASGGRNTRKTRAFRPSGLRLFLAFFILSVISAACTEEGIPSSENKAPSLQTGVEVGNLAPDFKIKNLKGGETALSDYKGKVVLLNFWATWCGPCRAEMPSMEALYRLYPHDKFEILAVSIDFGQDAPVKEFIDDFGFSFPVLLDDQLDVNNRYQIRVVPTSILVDQRGVVTHRLLGAKDWNDPNSKLFVDKLIAANS